MPRVGIDAGSTYLKIILADSGGNVKRFFYEPHFGEPLKKIETFLSTELQDATVVAGFTGFYSELLEGVLGFPSTDSVKALIHFTNEFAPHSMNIMDIGAKGARLIELNDGVFKDFAQNALCAAGTGSFLDQQRQRLELSFTDIQGFRFIENPPRVAARCAVFAKTDLIHRQQEGYSKEEMWNGLCRGMAANLVQTLLRGRKLSGKTAVAGGVAQNRWVMEWLQRSLGVEIDVLPDARLAPAVGAALLSNTVVNSRDLNFGNASKNRNGGEGDRASSISAGLYKKTSADDEGAVRPALALRLSKYPDFAALESWTDENQTEVRVVKEPLCQDFFFGLDVGSTSTKAVLVDSSGEITADFYRKTLGDPIGATTLILRAVEAFCLKYRINPEIKGAATTGSGRRISGLVIGADVIINEISAHARGALKLNPAIKTIFEIGGQDSKYIRLEDGNIVESNLNYVCAAGTGSFVEEQASKLGISLSESGPRALGKLAPYTSDRCTVFMEEDVERLLKKGFSRDEAMAAVLFSVVQNYLTKVVENRPIQGKITFQGATARNIGLVAAFENYLGREILVSPYCHVLGAYGAALAAMEKRLDKTKFRGIDLYKRKIEVSSSDCPCCVNHCTITYADIEGVEEKPSWGYMCGKEPDSKTVRRDANYGLFEIRRNLLQNSPGTGFRNPSGEGLSNGQFTRTVGIPMVLGFHTYLPFWKGFFTELGLGVQTTGTTDESIIERGTRMSSADFCLPVKVVHGHIEKLSRMNTDFIFLPHMLVMNKGEYYSHVCPYANMFPTLASSSPWYSPERVISPLIDVTWSEEENLKELYESLAPKTGCSRADVKRAWESGWKSHALFSKALREEGEKALSLLEGKGIVLVGRPYSLYDSKVSSNLGLEISRVLDMPVFPADFIPVDENIRWQEHRIFWDYGQTILNALKYASGHPDLFPIYVTHFACGPDSCLVTLAEQVMKGKPFMILEVDEHSSPGGYTTRIEAFREAIESYKPRPRKVFELPAWGKTIPDYDHRKVWVPPMHPVGSRFFASVFKKYGLDAEVLPSPDWAAMNIGKSMTSGKECMPAVVTIGTFVKTLREKNLEPDKQAFFMPSSDGPCRFGQYVNLHRIILDREGFEQVAIINPSSYNSYAGLSQSLRLDLWKASLYSDILTKLRCKVKPYEKNAGQTLETFFEAVALLEQAIEEGTHEKTFRKIVGEFRKIPLDHRERKPLVGVVGEIYVRCDPFSNEDLLETIEQEGGEVWLTPAAEFLSYSVYSQIVRARRQKNARSFLSGKVTGLVTHSSEKRFYRRAADLLSDRIEPSLDQIRAYTERYMPFECGTEAVLTLGRAIAFAVESKASLVVNVSPFTCMPGTQTTALFKRVQEEFNVPIINMFYDGEGGTNEKLIVYLRNLER